MRIFVNIVAALAIAGAGLASAARADDEWLPDFYCRSLPLDAPTGYEVKVFLRYLSLIDAKAEIYERAGDTLSLVGTKLAEKDTSLGPIDEIVRIYRGAAFYLESRLSLGLDEPEGGEHSQVTATIDGAELQLTLTCFQVEACTFSRRHTSGTQEYQRSGRRVIP